MNHRNPLSPFAHKTQVLMRAFSPRSPALRAALTGTTLGLAALAFAAPLITNGVSSLPEVGIDAGPALVSGTTTNSGFSGTCSENLQTVSLKIRHRVSGQLVEAPVVPCAGGVWQVAGLDLSGLNDGPLLLLAKHEDLAGQPTELSASLLKGGPAPRLGIDAPALIHPGNLESYRLSGTCSEEGRTIALTLTDAQGYRLAPTPLPTCSGQHWSTALSGLAALNDGVITLTVTHGEANTQGEIATLSAQALKNVALPGLSIDPLLFVKTANQTAFPVSGTCSEAQQPVSLTVSDRNKVTAYGVALCSGKGWRLPALDLSALADGELRFIATHARALPVVRTVMQAGLKDTATTVTGNGNAATLTPSASAPLAGNSTSTKAPSSLLQAQTLSFSRLTNKTLTNLPFNVAATASSGLPVSFSSLTPLVCTATGSQGATVSLLLLGTCTLQANQAGNSQYAAATPVQQSFTIGIAAADAMMGKPAIAAGGNHTIAIKGDPLKSVWTWGDNERGQLGDGTTLMRSTPVQVPNLSADGVGAGVSHSVALKTDGSIVAWGSNDFGQLGSTISTTNVLSPTPLVPLIGTTLPVFSAIAVGANHTLALTVDGKVLAWGANTDGQIGLNPSLTAYSPIPQDMRLSGVKAIAAGGNYSLALMADDTVRAWGRNGDTDSSSFNPASISGLGGGVMAIAAGSGHALALKQGKVLAWGNNWAGQLGNGGTTASPSPVDASTLTDVSSIGAGNSFSLAVQGGVVYAWGHNPAGQIGPETIRQQLTPTPVKIDSSTTSQNIKALAAGGNHVVAMKFDGTLWAWGDNGRGQLGDGKLTFRQEPVTISVLSAPVNVFAGAYHLISKAAASALSSSALSFWGSNWKGQLGEPVATFKSAPTSSAITATLIAAGAAHTLADVQSFGDNQAGELGRVPSGAPTPTWTASLGAVGGLGSPSHIAAGTRHSLASSGDGLSLLAWGANEAGQLGDGTLISVRTATTVSAPSILIGLTKIQSLAAGASHSVALVGTNDAATPPKVSGNVYVWGSNIFGQLGVSGTTTPPTSFQNTTPLILCGSNKTSAISVGWYHTAALCEGGVWTWGSNSMGQLGHAVDAATNAVSFPNGVTITKIATGAHHTLAMGNVAGTPTVTGKVWAWGSNQYGQLGDSSTTNRSTPIEIVSSGATDIAAGAGYSVIVKGTTGTFVIGDGRDGTLGLDSDSKTYAAAIRPVPTKTMASLVAGSSVRVALGTSGTTTQNLNVKSSLAGGAYKGFWLLIRAEQRGPSPDDFTELNTTPGSAYSVVNKGNVAITAADSDTPIALTGLDSGRAYRLFVCVGNGADATSCTGNAASVDFMTSKVISGATTYPLNVTIPAGSSNAGFVTTNVAGNDGTAMYCPSGSCSETYPAGQTVTLRAFPNSGANFTGWSNGCSGTSDCILSMTEAKNVTATFALTGTTGGTIQSPHTSYSTVNGTTQITTTLTRSGNIDSGVSIKITCTPPGANCNLFPLSLPFVAGQSSASFTINVPSSTTGRVQLALSSNTANTTIGGATNITVNLKKSVSLTPILMLLLD